MKRVGIKKKYASKLKKKKNTSENAELYRIKLQILPRLSTHIFILLAFFCDCPEQTCKCHKPFSAHISKYLIITHRLLNVFCS